MIITPLQQE